MRDRWDLGFMNISTVFCEQIVNKKVEIIFPKPIDKSSIMWYNIIIKGAGAPRGKETLKNGNKNRKASKSI